MTAPEAGGASCTSCGAHFLRSGEFRVGAPVSGTTYQVEGEGK